MKTYDNCFILPSVTEIKRAQKRWFNQLRNMNCCFLYWDYFEGVFIFASQGFKTYTGLVAVPLYPEEAAEFRAKLETELTRNMLAGFYENRMKHKN